jgi:hypothetical protein
MSEPDGSSETLDSGDEQVSDANVGTMPQQSTFRPEQLAQFMLFAQQAAAQQAFGQPTPQQQSRGPVTLGVVGGIGGRGFGGGGLVGFGGVFCGGSPLVPPPNHPPDRLAGSVPQPNFGVSFGVGGGGVSFGGSGGGGSGGEGGGGGVNLRDILARICTLEHAAASDAGDRPRASSPVGSVAASQASTMSRAVSVASLLDAIGLPDDESKFSRYPNLSRVWLRKLKEAKLVLNSSSTLAAVDALPCVGRALLRIMWAARQMLEAGAGDAERRALEESLAYCTEAEQELSTMFSLLSVLCSKTLGPHAAVLAEAARFARRTEGGLSCFVDNAVPDPFFADVLGNAFKKLSEQSLKEIYAKDKSGKKVSTDDDEAGADLRKELASTKKQLEKANNKLAGLGRQHGRKEDLSGAKSKKDDKPKTKPKDKDTAPSSEGAAP